MAVLILSLQSRHDFESLVMHYSPLELLVVSQEYVANQAGSLGISDSRDGIVAVKQFRAHEVSTHLSEP